MFLVICSHTMDDVPLGLFKTLGDAKDAANAIFARTSAEYIAGTVSEELTPAYWKTDASTPVCLDIVEFDGDGKPIACSKHGGAWSYDDLP